MLAKDVEPVHRIKLRFKCPLWRRLSSRLIYILNSDRHHRWNDIKLRGEGPL